jgi:glycosyltransferase involved in cell wall biosynthesis
MFAQGNSINAASRTVDNVQIYSLPSFPNVRMLEKAAAVMSMSFQVAFNALMSASLRADIIHVFDALFPQNAICVLVSKIKPRKIRPLVFVDWDDWWGRGGILNVFHKELGSPIIRFLTFMEEKIPLYSDAITVTCKALKRRALNVGAKPEKVFILPNGTNIGLSDYFKTQTARKLVNLPKNAIIYTCSKSFFTSINPYDDPLWDLLVAHKIVVKTFPNAFLVFLGGGSESCMATAKRFDMGKNIISIGYQPKDRYSLYLAASDFLLIPLKAYHTMFDGSRCPLRLLDYMAMGKPVIATDLPEIRKLLKDCGSLTKPNDSKDLADKIVDAIENLDSWKEKAEHARERIIQCYSWQHIAEELEKYYCAFMNEKFK